MQAGETFARSLRDPAGIWLHSTWPRTPAHKPDLEQRTDGRLTNSMDRRPRFGHDGMRYRRSPRYALVGLGAIMIVIAVAALLVLDLPMSSGVSRDARTGVGFTPTPAVEKSHGGKASPSSASLLGRLPETRPSQGSTVPVWVNVTAGVAGGPAARSNASAVWDAGDGFVLLFGGQSGSQIFGDTWIFRDGAWTLLHSVKNPTARYGAGIAYDASDGYVVLFGGANASGPIQDTWLFAGGEWNRNPTAPLGRVFPSMAYDPNLPGVIMIGGLQLNQSPWTWEFSQGAWKQVTMGPSGPPARVAGSMAFDVASNQLMIFGGLSSTPGPTDYFNNTWLFNYNRSVPNASSWGLVPTVTAPSPRFDGSIAYDVTEGAVVLFGGEGKNGSALSDTWLWNGTGWSVHPVAGGAQAPTGRIGGSMAPSATPGSSPSGADLAPFLVGGLLATDVATDENWFFGKLPLSILPPRASPAAVDVGHSTNLSAEAFGGEPPYAFLWPGLPTSCPTQNASEFTCIPNAGGTYTMSLIVNDSASATVQSASTNLSVTSLPTITGLTVDPSPATIGVGVTVTVSAQGGVPPLVFLFSGLPAGCVTVTSANFSCTPQATGTFAVKVLVTDADRVSARFCCTVLTVKSPSPSGAPAWEYIVEGGLIAVGVLVVLLVVRRGLRGRGDQPIEASKRTHPPKNVEDRASKPSQRLGTGR